MKQLLSHQTILEALANFYGIEAQHLTVVSGGADFSAASYRVEFLTRSYFVKVKHGAFNTVVPILFDLFRAEGIQNILQPVLSLQGRTVEVMGEYSLMVFPFVNGKSGFEVQLSPFQWVSLGRVLKQIHDLVIPVELQNTLRKETYSSQARDFVRSFYANLEKHTATDEIGAKAIQLFKDHQAVILNLVVQAEQLSKHTLKQASQNVLCHSDLHAGNVLLGEAGEFFIIDWDSPIFAPKERDLMFIGGGVAGVWNQHSEEVLFYQGYGSTKVNSTHLSYYRYERIVEDLAEYAQELILTESSSAVKATMYRYFTEMFDPGNVVEIAIETEERRKLK